MFIPTTKPQVCGVKTKATPPMQPILTVGDNCPALLTIQIELALSSKVLHCFSRLGDHHSIDSMRPTRMHTHTLATTFVCDLPNISVNR